MNARHIALIALSTLAIASGAAVADDSKVITSRSVTGFAGPSYTGPGLPDSVVAFDKVVRTNASTYSAYGRDGYVAAGTTTRPIHADVATEARVGRDIPAVAVRGTAPTTAKPAMTDKTGRS